MTRIALMSCVVSFLLVGCAKTTESSVVGVWKYDKISMREQVINNAIDSVTAGGADPISEEELADLRELIAREHEAWEKTIELHPGGSLTMRSKIGDGQLETLTGSWSIDGGILTIIDDTGEGFTGGLESGSLVVSVTDDSGVHTRVVWLPVNQASEGG